uniref:Major facilitator superfamily domain-containing protein 10 isoform X4 n=1 Tax=Callorhinus ursinus TaxID=34884 RepID=A0A3Q7RR18_CALUR|nr:major facilitator superfamily domain-containing protein 10 isoform X4 [Callorhinus ursinus]
MGWGAGGSCTPRPPIRQQTAQETRVITVVFLGLLLDLLAFTLLLPLLPGLLESHGRAHDPLYGSWQRGVDWFAAAIRMPAEKRYNSVLFGVPLGTAHGGGLGLSGEAPGDAAVPGSHRGGLLPGLHPGPHAGCLPARGDGTLARPALRCLRPAVYFLLPAGDPAPREAGTLHRPRVSSHCGSAQPPGLAPFLGRGPQPGSTCWRRAWEPSPPGPGVFPLPLPLLGPGVHPELPCPPALPVQQPAARKDVFLHRPHHGHRARCLRAENQPWQGDCSCEAGHLAARPRLPPHRLGAHAACAGLGVAAVLLRCRGRGALPVLCGCQLWLARAEGHNHGHPAEPGRPGQGGGTHGGRLSVLAGRGQDLLHRVLRPLPAPLPAPVESEASSPRAQGRVAEPAPPRTGGGGGERGGARACRPPPPPPPVPGPAQDGSRPAAPEGPRHSRPLPRCGRPCEAGGSDSKPFQAFCWLL